MFSPNGAMTYQPRGFNRLLRDPLAMGWRRLVATVWMATSCRHPRTMENEPTRAERSAALGCGTEKTASPEGAGQGRHTGEGVDRPFRATGTMDAKTQGDALGWNATAPLGLIRHKSGCD